MIIIPVGTHRDLPLRRNSRVPSLGARYLAAYKAQNTKLGKRLSAARGRDPSGGNRGLNKIVLTSDANSSITESPHSGATQASMVCSWLEITLLLIINNKEYHEIFLKIKIIYNTLYTFLSFSIFLEFY